MSSQHLSDEAVAAFADGVLRGHARERSTRHTAECAECAHAVRVQREAAWALRAASSPLMPSGLLDRLRDVPQSTPVTALPTAIGPDGSMMLSTLSPVAALVAPVPAPGRHRVRPIVTTAAVVALAGALAAGSVNHRFVDPAGPGVANLVRHTVPVQPPAVSPGGGVSFFGPTRP